METTGLGENTVLTLSYLVLAVFAPMLIFSLWSVISRRLGGKEVSLKSVFIGFSFAFLPIRLVAVGTFSVPQTLLPNHCSTQKH